MKTPARSLGHPIHPMLIVFPMGLWMFSLVCDLIGLSPWRSVAWQTVALYSIGGGIAGALLAAVPGLIDFLAIQDRRAKKLGALHLGANLFIVAMYAVNFGLRLAGRGGRWPLLLNLAGFFLLGVSGWLGGEMVYRHEVGIDPKKEPPGREDYGDQRKAA